MNKKNLRDLLTVFLVISNLFLIGWTIILTIEEIETGFGYGTNYEMMTLIPIIKQIICFPIVIISIIYFIKYRDRRNIILFVLLILQYILLNLFMFY